MIPENTGALERTAVTIPPPLRAEEATKVPSGTGDTVEAFVEFPFGDRVQISLRPGCSLNLSLGSCGVQAVRGHPQLLQWHARANGAADAEVWRKAVGDGELAAVSAGILGEVLGSDAGQDTTSWELGNLIFRDSQECGGSGNFNREVHRDHCENAGRNFGETYNCWVPLLHVTSYPLGFCLPSSVDMELDVGPATGLWEGDRTSLRRRAEAKLDWRYFPDLAPGDILLWKSDLVFHAATELAGDSASERRRRRLSVDLRIHWKRPAELR